MDDTKESIIDEIKNRFRNWGLIAVAVLVAFLVGLVPMWFMARNNAAERDAVRTELSMSEISNLLSSSIVDARRGEYELARQEASEFFTRLRAEDDKGEHGSLTADQRTKINTIFTDRDAVITMLAQRDPPALDRLTSIYVTYTQAVPSAQPLHSPARSN